MDVKTLQNKISEISLMGYVASHRAGDTGVGKTLEDLFGIKENNIDAPDIDDIEIKTTRVGSKTPITLFTKCFEGKIGCYESQNPVKLFREVYGTPAQETDCLYLFDEPEFRPVEFSNKSIEITITGGKWTKYGDNLLKLNVDRENGYVLIRGNNDKNVLFGYPIDLLYAACSRKLNKLLLIQATTQRDKGIEFFWYNYAVFFEEFNFNRFLELLENGVIVLDVRIGARANGSVHDHGTAFRVKTQYLPMLYNKKKVLCETTNEGNLFLKSTLERSV